MSENQHPWHRMEGEPGNWYARFLAFRDMGAARRGLYQTYVEEAKRNQKKPSGCSPGAWSNASDKWQWQKRADAYDAHMRIEDEAKSERLRNLEEEEEARLLSTGYARSARRVEQLSLLYDELKASYRNQDTGEIVYPWLNPDKVREMRGCLDDIAKEVGERIKKAELTGKDGGAIAFVCEWGGALSDETEEES